MDAVHLSSSKFSIGEVTELISSPSSGAISVFVGTTRDHFNGKKVLSLEYEAYVPMAEREMKKICEKMRQQWNVENIAIYHRLGTVPIQEASVIIAISSEHRHDSLMAVQYGIDTLKSCVPIWKKELYEEGETAWKENEECSWKSSDGFSKGTNSRIGASIKGEVDGDGDTAVVKSENSSEDVNVCPAKVPNVDPKLIQIKATNEELQRRIGAFIKRKREEVDITNVQEFCGHHVSELGDIESCARIDAVLERRKESKSHLRVTRVVNPWGPQTRGIDPGSEVSLREKYKRKEELVVKPAPSFLGIEAELNSANRSECELPPHGTEERLCNVEEHLQLRPGQPAPKDVYMRLKRIEDRILFLEGLSPEYFQEPPSKQVKIDLPPAKNGSSQADKKYSLQNLNERIEDLRRKLKTGSEK